MFTRACSSFVQLDTRKSQPLSSNYLLNTYVLSLKPLDIEIMKRLGTRVNLIPVIAKADTLTQNDLAVFKQRVRDFALGFSL